MDSVFLSFLFPQSCRIICAVSGGADSMAMLHRLVQYRKENNRSTDDIGVISCDHGLRHESSAEIVMVKTYCHQLGLSQFFATSYQGNIYDERALRLRRHQQIVLCLKTFGATIVCLGHHLDDRVETSVLNLVRGCHVDGLMAMKSSSPHFLDHSKTIIRPLIWNTKRECLDYCAHHSIPFCHDTTNDDSSISQRNYRRNEDLHHLRDSLIGLYARYDLLTQGQTKNITLTPLTTHPMRQVQRALQREIDRQSLTCDDLIACLKKCGLYINITQKMLDEWLHFLQTKQSGYKYAQGAYWFIIFDRVWIVKGPRDFWIPGSMSIASQDRENIEFLYDAGGLRDYSEKTFRFASPTEQRQGKTVAQWCTKKRVPSIWRHRCVWVGERLIYPSKIIL